MTKKTTIKTNYNWIERAAEMWDKWMYEQMTIQEIQNYFKYPYSIVNKALNYQSCIISRRSLDGKTQSYWRNEDEMTFIPATFESLSPSEKAIYLT
jgi:hypothetical protein